MLNVNNYLDLENLIINEIVGSTLLFMFIIIILVAYLGIKTNLTGKTIIFLEIVAISIYSLVLGTFDFLIIILLFVGSVLALILYNIALAAIKGRG